MKNAEGEGIEAAPHATMEVTARVSHPIPAGAYLRRRRGEKNPVSAEVSAQQAAQLNGGE